MPCVVLGRFRWFASMRLVSRKSSVARFLQWAPSTMLKSPRIESTQEQDRKDERGSASRKPEEVMEGRRLFEEIDLNLVPHA